jgi:hypothetical protein
MPDAAFIHILLVFFKIMTKTRLFALLCAGLFINALNAQTIPVRTLDTLGMHKVVKDASGKILAWYEPQTPGAGYAHVCKLASEFIKSGTPIDSATGLKSYLVTCCFAGPHIAGQKAFEEGRSNEGWMHNPAMTYAGMVQSLVLDYRVFSGDAAYIGVVKEMLDYQLANGTTPAHFLYANVPYASSDPFEKTYNGATRWENEGMRGDGLHGIEPDKVGELGYAYLKFYQVTGDEKYLKAAVCCADALAKNVRDVGGNLDNFGGVNTRKSPWPFRINARTGLIHDDYCANVIEPVKLFDELLRTSQRIKLSAIQIAAYQKSRKIAWNWLFSRNGPMYTYLWTNYFEDIPNDVEQDNRNQVSPMETARYLIKNPDSAPNLRRTVPALLNYVESAFGTEGQDAIKEQTFCYVPMGSHTARFASVCALWYAYTGDVQYKEKAYRYFNNATYITDTNGVVRVGNTWPSSWFSDGYSDYIKHFMEGLAAVPEWAHRDAVLHSTSAVQKIDYQQNKINLQIYDDQGALVARLMKKPKSVAAAGRILTENSQWSWQPLAKGGVLKINYGGGTTIEIIK